METAMNYLPGMEANQQAILQAWPRIELGTTVNKSSYRSERGLNLGLPYYKSSALTARPRCHADPSNLLQGEGTSSPHQ